LTRRILLDIVSDSVKLSPSQRVYLVNGLT